MSKKLNLKNLRVNSFVTDINGSQVLGGDDHTCVCPPPTYTCPPTGGGAGCGGTGGGGHQFSQVISECDQ